MNYGLYLSAAGVMTNSYRQDVIANNLANAETVGFKKDLALIMQRRTEAEQRNDPRHTNPILENIGGGIFAAPLRLDTTQGELEPSSNNLDTAIDGSGYFTVSDNGSTRLTRDGRFTINGNGQLAMANGKGQLVLSDKGTPIQLDPTAGIDQTTISKNGEIAQRGEYKGRIGIADVAEPGKLIKLGGNLMSADATQLTPSTARVLANATERANVDPTTELVQLMDCQRQLEANANMIRYQDAMLQHAANEIGKVS